MAKMIESVASRAATPFKNAPYTDFTRPENRQAQMEALEKVKRELGQTYPLIIGGEKITNEAQKARDEIKTRASTNSDKSASQ